jgi:hypothetical protein
MESLKAIYLWLNHSSHTSRKVSSNFEQIAARVTNTSNHLSSTLVFCFGGLSQPRMMNDCYVKESYPIQEGVNADVWDGLKCNNGSCDMLQCGVQYIKSLRVKNFEGLL